MSKSPLFPLKLDEIVVRRGQKTLLGPLTLEIEGGDEGRCVMLIGPNGSGKTTFLKLLQGLARPNSGNLRWNMALEEAHQFISLVFQTPIVLRRNVIQNVAFPLRVKGIGRKEATREAEEWLEKVGLENFATRRASVLSGGEKQRLAFARAMITRPQLLLLDEPTANLDNASKLEIEELLNQVMESGTMVIMASHEMGQVKRLATRVLFLNHGRLAEFSTSDTFPETDTGKRFVSGEIVL